MERALDYSKSKAALMLLTGYQTPDGLRRTGTARIEAWMHKRKARNANTIATAAMAAEAQHTIVPGQQVAAAMVVRLAKEMTALDTEIGDNESMIED